jgi:hypothetical protein
MPRAALLVALFAALACRDEDRSTDVRGAGLPPARLQPAARAAAYDAALRQAFDVDSSLVLLVDPALLPRDGSYAREDPLPGPVIRVLRQSGTVQGVCEPARPEPRLAPRCPAAKPGYAVRFSEVYRMPGDTVRLFVAAERFRTALGAGPAGPFAFESGFQLVRRGAGWSVVRQARRIKS